MNTMNRARFLGAVVVICSSLGAACAAPSLETDNAPTVEAYDGTTIFRGVFFGQGPAADAANAGRPEAEVTMQREAVARQLASLARHYRAEKLSASSQAAGRAADVLRDGAVDVHEARPAERARIVQLVIRRIHASDPTFFRRFGIAMRTGNAGFVERALKEASARIFAVSCGPDEVQQDDEALDSLKVDVEKENPPLAVKAKKAKKKKVAKSKKKVKRKKAKKQKKSGSSSSGGSNADKSKADKADKEDKEDKADDKEDKDLDKDTDELDDEFTDELDQDEAEENEDDDDVDLDSDTDEEDPEDPTDDEDGFASEEEGEDVDELEGEEGGEESEESEESGFEEGEGESEGGDESASEGGGEESSDEGGGDDVQAFRARSVASGAKTPTSSRASVVLGRAKGGSAPAFYAWRFPGAASGVRYAKKLSVVFAPK